MKTGLVVEGGGMKCAYSAGIFDRFLDEQRHYIRLLHRRIGRICKHSKLSRRTTRAQFAFM